MNIVSGLAEIAASHGSRRALVSTSRGREREMTFAQLDAASARAAALLADLGVGPGDRVLVFVGMSIELYVALLGVIRLGAVAVFIDPGRPARVIDACCDAASPRAVLLTPRACLLLAKSRAIRRIPRRLIVPPGWVPFGRWAARVTRSSVPASTPRPAGDSASVVREVPDDAPALLTFTSGSTGVPRAAARSHALLRAQHAALHPALELVAGEVDLTTLPVFALANMASGVTSIIPDADVSRPARIDARRVLDQIDRLRPVRTVASPAFLLRLLDEAERADRRFGFVRRIDTGGALITHALLARLARTFPAASIHALYGSTEAEPIAHIDAADVSPDDRARTARGLGVPAGLPVPHIDLAVIRDNAGEPLGRLQPREFEALRVPPGETGEIVVAGAHVLGGYLGGVGDDDTKFSVADRRWHRTGDAGRIDPCGRLWLLGRCRERVRDERGELYPFQVEAAAHEAVTLTHAAFVAHRGRRLLLLQAPVPEESIEHLGKELAWAKLDQIRVLPSLPLDRRHNSKIDYPALHALLDAAVR